VGTVEERVERAQAWLAERGASDLNARDVIVVAALDVRSRAVAEKLALANPAPLLAVFDDIVGVVAGSATVVPSVLVEQEVRRSRRSDRAPEVAPSPVTPAAPATPATPTTPVAPPPTPVTPAPVTPTPVPPPPEQPATYIPGVTEATPVASQPRTSPDTGQVDMAGFAEFAWGEQPALAEVAPLSFTLEGDRIRIAWPPVDPPAPVAVYRVVAAMDGEPYTPDKDVIAATTSLSIVDANPRQDPYQHVQVWASVGEDIPAAKRAQPTLHARGLMVQPPASFDIIANEGQVVGRWHVADDVAVDVMCIEVAYADRVIGFEPTRRLETVVQGGFTHQDAPSGQQLEYRAVARVSVVGGDGQLRAGVSPHIARTVETPAVIEAVDDLRVEPSARDSSLLDISWTPPASGSVDIYMTDVEPQAGLERQANFDRTGLDIAGLSRDHLLINPTSREEGRTWMRGVRWSHRSARGWFVPVTVLDQTKMKVGKIQVRSRPPEAVIGLRLIDRVDTKTLTLEWPDAVDLVRVYVKPLGVPLDPEVELPVAELTQENYRRFGGLQLPAKVLDADRAMVYAVSTSYSAGRAIFAKPVAIEYPGLRQISYQIIPPASARPRRGAEPSNGLHLLRMEASETWDEPVNFGLFYNPDLLPISQATGELKYGWTWTPSKEQPFEKELDLRPAPGGYVRVLAVLSDAEQQRLAIQDPPVGQLRLT
jgi:hypothetical protein